MLRLENPQGMTMFGLSREVLEGQAVEPEEITAGLDAVTAEDVQRVAQDVIASAGINLALIGPFEDAAPFEELLASAYQRRQVGLEVPRSSSPATDPPARGPLAA